MPSIVAPFLTLRKAANSSSIENGVCGNPPIFSGGGTVPGRIGGTGRSGGSEPKRFLK